MVIIAILGLLGGLLGALTAIALLLLTRMFDQQDKGFQASDLIGMAELVMDQTRRATEAQLAVLTLAIEKSAAAVAAPGGPLPPPSPDQVAQLTPFYMDPRYNAREDGLDPTDQWMPNDGRTPGAIWDSDEPFGIPGLKADTNG